MKNLVSVVIPAYNAAGTLPKAMESVLDQTHEDLELIVVDDASEDETGKIVKKYEKQDPRVKYIRHKKNRERSATRNTGIKNATGSFIAFLDSDDKWLPEKLEKQLSYLRRKGDDWKGVYCRTIKIEDRSDNPISEFWDKIGENLPREGGRNLIKSVLLDRVTNCGSTFLGKKKTIQRIGGFDTSLDMHEDWEFLIRFLKVGKIGYLDEALAVIERRGGSSFSSDIRVRNKKKYIKKVSNHINNFEKKGYPILSFQYLHLAKFYHESNDSRKAFRYILNSLKSLRNCKKEYVHIPLKLLTNLILAMTRDLLAKR